MDKLETGNPNERCVYEERLAILGATGREPMEQEHSMAMADMKEYRLRVAEIVAALGSPMGATWH
jgi:hypothetical protein